MAEADKNNMEYREANPLNTENHYLILGSSLEYQPRKNMC
jgi:hypothetical protein